MNTQKANILVVDDHEAMRFLLGLTLSKQYDVITKRDGLEGLAWLSAGNIPNLIMLDMEMPRLNGLNFLKQVRSSGMFRDIPVLLITANNNVEDITKSYDLGIDGFIRKPFNPTVLKEKILRVIESREFIYS